MPDYSLVPVDYQPDFDDYSFAPVDHDPFAADGLTQQAQLQQPPTPTQPVQPQPQSPPQQPATGAGQPGVNGPRPATVPADRVAALASSDLAAPKVATFRAAMRGSVSRARTAHGMRPLRKCKTLGPNTTRTRPRVRASSRS
jgi:hypothetical protein